MITYRRATIDDMGAVKAIARLPEIWHWIAEDGADPEALSIDPEHVWVVLCHEGRDFLGAVLFVQKHAVHFETHLCLAPTTKGRAAEAVSGALAWMFENSPAERITAGVPDDNRLTLRLSESVGMTKFGYNPGVFMRGGRLIGETLMGLNKGRLKLCRQH